MKHTPGPWEVCIGEVDGGLFEIYQGEINTICRGDDEMIDWKANARLIAAAPEMLEALEDYIDLYPFRDKMNFRQRSTFDKAKRAIAKAKGE